MFHATGLNTNLAPTLEQLAQLEPTTLALMHGASYSGDGAAQLRALSEGYAAMAAASYALGAGTRLHNHRLSRVSHPPHPGYRRMGRPRETR